jgi:hypothetical protein
LNELQLLLLLDAFGRTRHQECSFNSLQRPATGVRTVEVRGCELHPSECVFELMARRTDHSANRNTRSHKPFHNLASVAAVGTCYENHFSIRGTGRSRANVTPP